MLEEIKDAIDLFKKIETIQKKLFTKNKLLGFVSREMIILYLEKLIIKLKKENKNKDYEKYKKLMKILKLDNFK